MELQNLQNKIKDKTAIIGWVGTGIMGGPMCGHLMNAGYKAYVYNRTKSKADKLTANGADWSASPKAVSEKADVVFSIVGFPADVEEVYFSETGILAGAKPGCIVIDMTTTEPSLSKKIFEAAKERGIFSIDAPVSGGDIGAINATLSIMVGGEKQAIEAIMPLFQLMGKSIGYQGVAGSGQHTKMCNQITLSGIMMGVAQALIYGYKAGLDLPTLISSISKGAAGCWVLDHLAPKMAVHNFDPGFYVEHYFKDLGIAIKEAKRMNLQLPGLELAIKLYERVIELGHGKAAYHALLLALEEISAVDISK